ncbi:gamma-glutamylcyclotransferase family protein [Sedimenticola selenatireducens]|uniref:Gamma-glutamylcyclotransferase n=1 Tax=Sedimenticola selenatireducens TaxID=191960 RepID=A0A557SJZ6_9GAMM|nr:gamma-glutamylcyclotransferase family protein [Sedimenticola selenatireducens]TVO77739.1 gamma-glutamylcyclotransferase [Sedimenticola selenatireducens]TVT65044.1 MAG: gamma-glutamylcyclotransferase [Sedimenticola selenatireducens]
MSYLFVYGTLLRAIGHPKQSYITQYCHFHSPGKLRGKLYDIGRYPGVVPSTHTNDWVHGELYQIRQEKPLIQLLDEYEGCSHHFADPHEYRRVLLPIERSDGTIQSAWVYIYTHDTTHLKPILTGDYLTYYHAINN